jgi:hypothetical protein
MIKVLALMMVCFSVAFCADVDISDGNISKGKPTDQSLRQMSRFQNMKRLVTDSISGTEFVIETQYPGMELVQVFNTTAQDSLVSFKTKASGGSTATAVDVFINSHSCSPFVLPPIYSIVKSGTTCDTMLLLMQKR